MTLSRLAGAAAQTWNPTANARNVRTKRESPGDKLSGRSHRPSGRQNRRTAASEPPTKLRLDARLPNRRAATLVTLLQEVRER